MSQAIDDLKHEHQAILTALDTLERMVARMDKGTAVAASELKEFMGFLKDFADKCHHGKEEGLLFPALRRAGVPQEGGPIGVMLSEHEQGRALIKRMEQAVDAGPKGGPFKTAALEYSRLLRSHIEKENLVLFPAAERALAPGELQDLHRKFDEHEETVMGKGRHEELHEMLKRLKTKYS